MSDNRKPDIYVLWTGGWDSTFRMVQMSRILLDYILLAKAVDGVYDSDPAKNPDAKRYDTVSIDEVIAENLQVVDMTASILARDNNVPMRVFALQEENSIVNAASGKFNGTTVTTRV